MNTNPSIRKAHVSDIPLIHRELGRLGAQGLLLPRPLSELYAHIRDFFIWQDPGSDEPSGWCALQILWHDLAEIRSLVVRDKHRHQGIGKHLVEACLDEARHLGVTRVFTLTYEIEFFKRLGFRIVDKHILPQKIWAACLYCSKFPDCDETAMLLVL